MIRHGEVARRRDLADGVFQRLVKKKKGATKGVRVSTEYLEMRLEKQL